MVGLVREVAHVVDNLLAVHVSEAEGIFLIDEDGIVGMAYLPCPGAHQQFAVAADGEVEATLVDVLA